VLVWKSEACLIPLRKTQYPNSKTQIAFGELGFASVPRIMLHIIIFFNLGAWDLRLETWVFVSLISLKPLFKDQNSKDNTTYNNLFQPWGLGFEI
jgi:hypothetical protein